jgi:hypothetical protein
MATEFPTFVDVPSGETSEPGTPDVDAAFLNALTVAVNILENQVPAKVNVEDLAQVATSGAYDDLIGRPFIPDSPDDIGAQPAGSYQTADADLTAIAALSPTNDDVLQRKGGAWTNRTIAQLSTDLGISGVAARLDALDGVASSANAGSATTLTVGNGTGTAKLLTLNSATCALTFAVSGTGIRALELVLTQDATGGRLVTWPSSVRWPGGDAPTLSTAAGAVDRLVFVTYNGGTTWYGDVIGLGYA